MEIQFTQDRTALNCVAQQIQEENLHLFAQHSAHECECGESYARDLINEEGGVEFRVVECGHCAHLND